MTSNPENDVDDKSLRTCIQIINSVKYFDAEQAAEMKAKGEKIQKLMGNIEAVAKLVAQHRTSGMTTQSHSDFVKNLDKCSASDKPNNEVKQMLNRLKKPSSRPVADSDDDDVQEEVFNYVNKDPLTKAPITKPVKNKICGHVYDAVTILAYIKDLEKKKFLRQCPQSGCHNRRNLIMTDMLDFPEFFSLCK